MLDQIINHPEPTGEEIGLFDDAESLSVWDAREIEIGVEMGMITPQEALEELRIRYKTLLAVNAVNYCDIEIVNMQKGRPDFPKDGIPVHFILRPTAGSNMDEEVLFASLYKDVPQIKASIDSSTGEVLVETSTEAM